VLYTVPISQQALIASNAPGRAATAATKRRILIGDSLGFQASPAGESFAAVFGMLNLSQVFLLVHNPVIEKWFSP